MDRDLHSLVAEPKQMMRLDQLEALVDQRRRVDRDPAPHLPGGVGERLLGRHRGEIAAPP